MTKPIGIFGGTFDPIHYGHLRSALELKQILTLEQIRFIPCQQPVHKSNVYANAKQRLEMLKLATQSEPDFVIDPREVYRDTPSYMIETLSSLKQDFTDIPLLLIMGSDAFAELPQWHQWDKLLNFCHIVIVMRPGHRLNLTPQMQQYLNTHNLADANYLEKQLSGGIYVQSITALDISATMIRAQLSANISPKFLLPEAVLSYINQQNLYKEIF
ncbi:MAG: nicotinic acid mononucleotide adenylyltransferase [Legionellales bacterium]|nr:nicotinic acid mononucleotide adenylyltransferase [Legionellales bacterium]